MKRISKVVKTAVACMLSVAILGGCSDGMGISDTKVVFTTGLGKEDVFRIEDEICTLPEMMVYLTTAQNQYEEVYGAEIWQVDLNGASTEDSVKETVLAQIAQIKSMYLLAVEKEIVLTETEEQLVNSAAAEYYSSLSSAEQELLGVNQETIQELYREYLLARRVYESIIKDVNPEISDDEARRVTVQHIWLKNYLDDGAGKQIQMTQEELSALYEDAAEIREMAVSGSQDFEQLASKYSDSETITYSFGKGESEIDIEDVVFVLETGEISEVIETGTGYHIFKCLSTLDRDETDANKLKIVEQRRNEAFAKEYDSFINTLDRKLNQKLWDSISFIRDEQVDTADFFDIYNKYLGNTD